MTTSDIKIINKTMDPADLATPEAKAITDEFNQLLKQLHNDGLKVSAWFGGLELGEWTRMLEQANRGYNYQPLPDAYDDRNWPWFLYWELTWVLLNADIRPGQKVLDLGGCSSLLSLYLASKGCDVTAVDIDSSLVEYGNHIAQSKGWNLKNLLMDMREMRFNEKFDHVVSICVYEHIPLNDRIKINQTIKGLLNDGGRFSITFDYRNPSRFVSIDTPKDVYRQFVEASGLTMRENQEFYDDGSCHLLHPFYHTDKMWRFKWLSIKQREFGLTEFLKTKTRNDYTFGSIFLQK